MYFEAVSSGVDFWMRSQINSNDEQVNDVWRFGGFVGVVVIVEEFSSWG